MITDLFNQLFMKQQKTKLLFKAVFFFLGFFFLAIASFAQGNNLIEISGNVIEQDTKQPLEGAIVSAKLRSEAGILGYDDRDHRGRSARGRTGSERFRCCGVHRAWRDLPSSAAAGRGVPQTRRTPRRAGACCRRACRRYRK